MSICDSRTADQSTTLITSVPASLWLFFFSSRRRHTRCSRDWSSDVCSSDLIGLAHSRRDGARVVGDVGLVARRPRDLGRLGNRGVVLRLGRWLGGGLGGSPGPGAQRVGLRGRGCTRGGGGRVRLRAGAPPPAAPGGGGGPRGGGPSPRPPRPPAFP